MPFYARHDATPNLGVFLRLRSSVGDTFKSPAQRPTARATKERLPSRLSCRIEKKTCRLAPAIWKAGLGVCPWCCKNKLWFCLHFTTIGRTRRIQKFNANVSQLTLPQHFRCFLIDRHTYIGYIGIEKKQTHMTYLTGRLKATLRVFKIRTVYYITNGK